MFITEYTDTAVSDAYWTDLRAQLISTANLDIALLSWADKTKPFSSLVVTPEKNKDYHDRGALSKNLNSMYIELRNRVNDSLNYICERWLCK